MRRWALGIGLLGLFGLIAIVSTGVVAMAADNPSQSEMSYRSGKAIADDEKEARQHYRRGIDSARGVLASTPDAPAALLWLAANLAGEALTHGRMFALRVIPEIESSLLRLELVHPLFDHAAAARALANLYAKAPALISVGSSKKAATYFSLALQRAPQFPGNQAMAAAFFAAQGDCGRARALAAAVSARTDLDTFGPDAIEWRQLARAALRTCK
ncbi:MAG: hypothetical protein H7X95_11010 [Deltaproteobacteria bacterium]|nr:hypothetical protein [Deltaproteobacteria bacterium]